MAQIVTWPFIFMTGMWAMLDQCSPFSFAYLSFSRGHSLMLNSLRDEGSLSSGSDSTLGQFSNLSDFRAEGNVASVKYSSLEIHRNRSVSREERCQSPIPSKDFIFERWVIVTDTREIGNKRSFNKVLTISLSPPIVNFERAVRCWRPHLVTGVAIPTDTI